MTGHLAQTESDPADPDWSTVTGAVLGTFRSSASETRATGCQTETEFFFSRPGRLSLLQIDGPPAPETLRSDRLARRQRIVRAGLKARASSDYDQVKISDVARDSGVALGTLYRYFTSTEHLFAAVFVEWHGALKKKLDGL